MSGMPGVRTPTQRPATTTAKTLLKSPQKAPEEEGSSTQSVRKSVGEWEAGSKTVTKRTPPKQPAHIPPMMAKGAIAFEVGSPPPPKSRVAEARTCSNKIKALMTQSKTTKNEIKAEVKAQADRLYQLIKECTQENGNEPQTRKTFKSTGTQLHEDQGAEKTPRPPLEANAEAETTSLRKALEEHSKNLAENSLRMDRLKEALQASQDQMGSYASVAASRPSIRAQNSTTLHSLVVSARDEKETGDQVLDRLRRVVNAREGGIAVEKVRKAKDRKIILGCRTEEDRNRLREKLGQAPELEAQDVKNKNPQVILRDLMQYNTNEDILKALQNQNAHIFRGLKDELGKVEILYRKRTRNPHTGHVVMRVATEVWRRMLEAGAVHVDLQRVRVEDQSPLVQCSLCLGYGHSRRMCTDTVPKCGHCGGPHMRTECADWSAGLPPSCCNCTRVNYDNTSHNAFSSECLVRRRWEAIARSAIAYC